MHFRNFLSELKDILKRGAHVLNFQVAWKKAIIQEINHALYIEGMEPDDDLTSLAFYRLLERYYAERGGKEGFKNIIKMWANL